MTERTYYLKECVLFNISFLQVEDEKEQTDK